MIKRRLHRDALKKISVLFVFFVIWPSYLLGHQYPLRTKYSDLVPITTKDLNSMYGKVIIIDARSEMEYEVIHIRGAHNILVGKMQESNLLKLRGKTGKQLLVFYCNGITCAKSYKAAEKAVLFGFKNIRVYDTGIFNWAEAHPEKTLLFGEQLTKENLKDKLISKSAFLDKNIPTRKFIEKYKSGRYTTIDIRDFNERKENPIKLPKVKHINLNAFMKLITYKKGPVPLQDLLIFDNVGKQTRWLQYYLVKYGRSNYFFLKGGVRQWYKDGYTPEGVKQ